MRHYWFPIWKRGIFRLGKEIEGLRGGVRLYAAQACPKIDAARAEKDRFRMETSYSTGIATKSELSPRRSKSLMTAPFLWAVIAFV